VLRWVRRSIARKVALVVAGVAALIAAGAVAAIVAVAPGNPHVRALAGLSGVLCVAGAAIAAALSVRRTLGAPLRRLAATVERAEQGDFLVRAEARGEDEIAQLARSFNRMLARITDLDARVIDAHRELGLQREIEARVRDLTLLSDISGEISSAADVDKVLGAVLHEIGSALALDETALLLVGPGGEELVVRATYGFPSGEEIEGMTFALGEGISGIVAATGRHVMIADTSQDRRYLHYKGRHRRDGSFVSVPVKFRGRLVGLLNVLRPRVNGFTENDVRVLRGVASITGLAIGQARIGVTQAMTPAPPSASEPPAGLS
jgi:nitrate/nitrite-specific signal transduction histidine kinase